MASLQRQDQANLPCPAWVWSNNHNVHVAKDRSWFGDDYVSIDSAINNGATQVVGIGTVELPTETFPHGNNPGSHGILRLKNVLHAPDIFLQHHRIAAEGKHLTMFTVIYCTKFH
ncbi:hypothetical protein FVEN_g2960 [Fusarium venenatum]|uniref:Uncharacterized protein n=1 Tax=Fusarium venenatum TaxID=56646 RepID=A0A2L2TN10_9HYPO|nr:uncharacterized protein FVRRES_06346 [Fusarium venenatum]KAG8359217.1 hypothetical protein FVEN_g2960 [Fusarium venenatum]KAH6993348.1 hypothetical protein EDB82DRAFT_171263 [Fusarium venenatum]CEI61910.1 unnamed protein product [Fusarium venenatum]